MAGNFDDAEKIIEATDIVALVSKYVKLEKQGKNYKGLCPFHNEDTPSFVVSPDKKVAHCFGCGGGGNPVNFLMQVESIGFQEALAKLAEMNGMEYHSTYKKVQNPNEKYLHIMSVAHEFYKTYMNNSQEGITAKEYLKSRGMSENLIKTFGVGLSPKIGDTLYQVLKESNFLELDMADVSLVEKNARGQGYHDIFCERIMFPICDEKGNPIAFSARIFNSKDKNQPKYINSRESAIFHKNEVLFNYHLAKGEILKKKRVILHEGQMDVIASYRSGLPEAVCTMGTALSDYHAKTLAKNCRSVVICYDGDGAGIKASKKAIQIFKNNGFQIHLVLLPDGMDPDEYTLKFGEEAYKSYFEGSLMDPNEYLFTVSFINKNLTDSNVVLQIKEEVFSLIQSMTSQMEVEKYLKKFAEKLSSSYEAVLADFESFSMSHAIPQAIDIYPNEPLYPEIEVIPTVDDPFIETKPVRKTWNSLCEPRLFMYARSSKGTALYIDNEINNYLNAFSFESQQLWITLINSFYESFDEFIEAKFVNLLSEEQLSYYLEMLEALRGDKNPYNDEDMRMCIEKLKIVSLDEENKQLEAKIKASMDITEQSRWIDRKIKNKKLKEQLIKKGRK